MVELSQVFSRVLPGRHFQPCCCHAVQAWFCVPHWGHVPMRRLMRSPVPWAPNWKFATNPCNAVAACCGRSAPSWPHQAFRSLNSNCLICPTCPISTEFRKGKSHQAACHYFQIKRQILRCLLKCPCTWIQGGKKFGVSPQEPCVNSALTRRQILLCREIPRFMMNQNESNWIRDFSRWFTESSRLLQASSSRDLSGQRPFAFPNLGASEASTQDLDSLGKFGLFRFSCLEICCDIVMCCDINSRYSSWCFQTVRVILDDFGPLEMV